MMRNKLKCLLLAEVTRNDRVFQAAARADDLLAQYESVHDVLDALGDPGDRVPYADKEMLLAAILSRLDAEPKLWSAVLMLAFAPMLGRLRRRARRAGAVPHDFDELVDEAFLEALSVMARHQRGPRFLRLKSATTAQVFRQVRRHRADLGHCLTVAPADLPEVEPVYGAAAKGRCATTDEREELLGLMEARGLGHPASGVELIVGTCLRGTRLRELASNERTYQRLKRQRTRARHLLEPLREQLHEDLDARLARAPLDAEPWGHANG